MIIYCPQSTITISVYSYRLSSVCLKSNVLHVVYERYVPNSKQFILRLTLCYCFFITENKSVVLDPQHKSTPLLKCFSQFHIAKNIFPIRLHFSHPEEGERVSPSPGERKSTVPQSQLQHRHIQNIDKVGIKKAILIEHFFIL